MTDLQSNQVFCTGSPAAGYCLRGGMAAPELGPQVAITSSIAAIRRLFFEAGLDRAHYDDPGWNPLGDVIRSGDKVLIKPNWVHHLNGSGAGLDCLVTHTDVIEAILLYALKARPASIVIGDAPIQDCDLDTLLRDRGVREMVERVGAGYDVSIRDFRLTRLPSGRIDGEKIATQRTLDQYVSFDLAAGSRLEPITVAGSRFRVTKYDPRELAKTHGPGRHRYLVAREVVEADIVINVPKLKTHKKACVTGALKNVVGINGHKSYLPHHRRGGSANGGDCYEGRSRVKALSEAVMDAINVSSNTGAKRVLARTLFGLAGISRVCGADNNLEGSWHGNDTIWRACLDLQTILHYGRADGTIAPEHQRRVINITDAIVVGEGEGPLAPTPVPFGLLSMGSSAAAVDWVHALLMGFDPARISVTRECFADDMPPLAGFGPEQIEVNFDGERMAAIEACRRRAHPVRAPRGWRGHCELSESPVVERTSPMEAMIR